MQFIAIQRKRDELLLGEIHDIAKIRDPRLITVRRGGSLTDSHHHLLAMS